MWKSIAELPEGINPDARFDIWVEDQVHPEKPLRYRAPNAYLDKGVWYRDRSLDGHHPFPLDTSYGDLRVTHFMEVNPPA